MKKSVIGIGLMKPSTIVDAMKLKLFVRNKRRMGNTRDFAAVIEEHQEIEVGRKIKLRENPFQRYWKPA